MSYTDVHLCGVRVVHEVDATICFHHVTLVQGVHTVKGLAMQCDVTDVGKWVCNCSCSLLLVSLRLGLAHWQWLEGVCRERLVDCRAVAVDCTRLVGVLLTHHKKSAHHRGKPRGDHEPESHAVERLINAVAVARLCRCVNAG